MRRREGERRRLTAVAVAISWIALACSSRYRLGLLESDEPVSAGGASSVAEGGQASEGSGAAKGGGGAANPGHGQAGDGSAGDAAPPRLPPDVFVAH